MWVKWRSPMFPLTSDSHCKQTRIMFKYKVLQLAYLFFSSNRYLGHLISVIYLYLNVFNGCMPSCCINKLHHSHWWIFGSNFLNIINCAAIKIWTNTQRWIYNDFLRISLRPEITVYIHFYIQQCCVSVSFPIWQANIGILSFLISI